MVKKLLRPLVKIMRKIIEDARRLWRYPAPIYGMGLRVDYDAYWHARRKPGSGSVLSDWQKQRADLVLPLFKKGDSVLDIGCGDGAVLRYFRDNKEIKGVGLDMSDVALTQAKELGIETIKMDITNLSEIATLPEVDYVTGFEIIEHMPLPEEFIFHIESKARIGLIFSVPNTGYYAHRLRLLCGRFPLQWVTHPGEHVRFWTVRDMKVWVDSLGFDMKHLMLYEGVPLLNRLFPKLFSQGMIITIQKKNKRV